MNKQLTKRTIAIAASAALMASVALSGSALAARGGNPQVSLDVAAWCKIKYEDQKAGKMTVYYTIFDKSSGKAFRTGMLSSVALQAVTKSGGPKFGPIYKGEDEDGDPILLEGSKVEYGDPENPYDNPLSGEAFISSYQPADVQSEQLNVCGDNLGKAINAQLTVTLLQPPYSTYPSNYPGNDDAYTAQCGNAPGDDGIFGTADDIVGGGLKTADYDNLCK